ncbi:MAG TPA: EamA family transporter RarD [Thermoanaerobaculia bacterium]|nr:EamA family transporter RarD [Thermoanaerobaculia bacterium]
MARPALSPAAADRDPAAETRRGVAYAGAAFLFWGLAPIYWKALGAVPPAEVLAHRVVWSFVLLTGMLVAARRGRELVAAVRRPKTLATLVLTTALIAVNWYVYIWAIDADRVLESSLGYFVNPLVNVLLGVAFLRERLPKAQAWAVAIAAVGVAILTVEVGRVPWVALALAGTFGFYGLLRKTVDAGPQVGLAVETALLTPLTLLWLGRLHAAGDGHLGGGDLGVDALLVGAGLVTVLPLVWFTQGARLLPLSALGLLQYLAPTLQFLLAVLVYREPFTARHLAAFAVIWAALGVFTWDLRRRVRQGAARGAGRIVPPAPRG